LVDRKQSRDFAEVRHDLADGLQPGTADAPIVRQPPIVGSRFASRQEHVRHAIAEHCCWIEASLGCSLGEAVILNFDFGFSQLIVDMLMPGQQPRPQGGRIHALQPFVESVELPPGFAPSFDFARVRDLESPLANSRRIWSAVWTDGPALLHFKSVTAPVVVMHVPYLLGDHDAPQHQDIAIAAACTVTELLRLIAENDKKKHPPALYFTPGEGQQVSPCAWDDLVLDPGVVQLVRNDFETFFDREDWFHHHRLPFRRGYLFYGPPGNGKSSAIKAMMTSRGLDAFSIRLFHHYTSDDDLDRMFSYASDSAPALVVIEDIDRAFPRGGQSKCQVSMQQLLNCLDGIATQEGVIVVATANEPTSLDAAILKRPGRFDRVVCFPLPNPDLRRAYFSKLHPALTAEALDEAASHSEGFSFAQLREAYILAGQYAFASGGDVSREDLIRGITTLRRGTQIASIRNHQVGFNDRSIQRGSTDLVNVAGLQSR
jgi:hypothetical protein